MLCQGLPRLISLLLSEVESDPWCQKVLTQRINDGAIPWGRIVVDVKGYQPEGKERSAKAILAGFPCQGISQAGSQQGLQDERSNLIQEVFLLFDRMPDACLSCIATGSMCSLRQMLFLENVGALLSTQKACRDMLTFIQEARNTCHL